METKQEICKRIITFIAITFALSSIFYLLIIASGRLSVGGGLYVLGLMWCPGVAAILTQTIYRKKGVVDLGWRWGNTRYHLISYALPFLYALIAYSVVWFSGLGGFYNEESVKGVAQSFDWGSLPAGLTIVFYLVIVGVLGIIQSCGRALGEEIGWRGFLVPELAKLMSFSKVSIISGLVWSVWHYPLLIFADYNSGTPLWYGLICFTVMAVGISFAFAWLRLASGSLWTAMILHASHNVFIQGFFTPLTKDTGVTAYIIDEFGAALAIVSLVVAIIFWKLRSRLPHIKRTGQRGLEFAAPATGSAE